MSSSLSEANLEKKFQAVANTQDSIQTLSLWLLHHKAHHHKIVAAWMKVLQKAKITHRLTLFYLANDVVQNSRRKGFLLFVNSFAEVLKEATLLVRDEQIRHNVKRVFAIWEQRNVYSPEFIADLTAILGNAKVPATAPSKLLANFKPEMVIKQLRSVMKLEMDSNKKKSTVNLSKLNATDAEIVQQLKDRIHGQQFKTEFDDSIRNLEGLVELMSQENAARNELILLLEQSEIYYDQQRGEAKVVVHAYKTFGGKVKNVQKELGNLKLPSPIPSPTLDAPSPTTSDKELELSLPNDSEENGMTSWLDAFASKNDSIKIPTIKKEAKTADTSSLDSRLSNLLQNIPNLPPGLQNSLLSNASSGNNTPQCDTIRSPVTGKKDKLFDPSSGTGSLTPVKDEYSGQNTPLQDEDTHSSHSIFSKLASSNKSQSSKDIFKGLTNLLQSASAGKDETQPKDKFPSYSSPDFHDQQGGMSTFIKSQPSQLSSSSSPFFGSPQSSLPGPIRTLSSALPTTVASYQTSTFDSLPSYSTQSPQGEEHLSYIPSLVPSTPLDNFSFSSANFSTDEYNPEMQIFDTDMDLDEEIEESEIEVPSPEIEPLSPPVATSVSDELPRSSIPGRRLSTLITVVTEGSPGDNQQKEKSPFSSEDMYKSDKENVTQEALPSWNDVPPLLTDNIPILADEMKNSPSEEFFIGKNDANVPAYFTSLPPPPQPPIGPPCVENGKFMNPVAPAMDLPLSRIETVQSQREDMNGRWFGNNWTEDNRRNDVPEHSPPVLYGPPDPPPFFNNNRNFQRPNYPPRQNYPPRPRFDAPFNQKRFQQRPYGPSPNKRFPFRGRGWGRPPQY